MLEDFPVPIYTRVTESLAPFSGMDKIDSEVLARASLRGTAVHEQIECIQEGLPEEKFPIEWQGYINSYKLWSPFKKFIETPKRFFDDDHMITGLCDCIYQSNEGLVLVDFKTSANESKTWKHQGSAYSYLAKKVGYDIKRIEFVKLSKEGKAPKSYFYTEDIQSYWLLLSVYREFFYNQKSDMGDF